MNDRIVIFGAASGAVKALKALKNIGLDIEFFVDNDKEKHGKFLEGKVICHPNVLLNDSVPYKIVIASVYHGEIEEQLISMGIKRENIILKEQYILGYIDSHLGNMIDPTPKYNKNQNYHIFMDLGDGISLGGIEKWGITIAEAFHRRKMQVTILTAQADDVMALHTDVPLIRFDMSYERYIESVNEAAKEIIAKLPCVVLINKINQIYMAAFIVKRFYGEDIKIISVIHSDFARTYEQNQLVDRYTDAYLCVSNDVQSHFLTRYPINKEKVFFKDSPIAYDYNYKKKYSPENEPVRIGYAGRLEKAQKRADLLIPLVKKLVELNLPFRMEVAGNGSYFNYIQDFILLNSYSDKVRLHGVIPFDSMVNFWKECDIVINLSDIEGIGLSMLEAMSYGAVPVVTDTAGASSFITYGRNGFVCDRGDTDAIAYHIKELSDNREKLRNYGNASRKIIKDRCNQDDYMEYLERMIAMEGGKK